MHVLLRHSCGQLGFSINPHTPFYTHIHYTTQRLDTRALNVPTHGIELIENLFICVYENSNGKEMRGSNQEPENAGKSLY